MKSKATFALGCFWGPDEFFSNLKGVLETTVGYSGGTTKNPTYENIGDHTETVEIIFDDAVISYETLLEYFWREHDPTREAKVQYKSIIFYHDEAQQDAAEKSKKMLEEKIGRKIVTDIRMAAPFYKAEDYHQKYFKKHKGVC